MKNIKYLVTAIFFSTMMLVSCDEQDWLEEKPYDFYSPDNSYATSEQMDLAVVKLYERTSKMLFGSGNTGNGWLYQYTTDVGYDAISATHELNSWADKITPETEDVSWAWNSYYKIIFDANSILDRIVDVDFSSEDERNQKIAEAKFFRAFAYRGLGIMFGGVPLVLEEIASPKRDFVRATQNEIWTQIIKDLNEALPSLPLAGDVQQDGRITKGAVNHLLAEMYIITQEYDKAISSASAVIDNSSYALMTSRFGTRAGEPGDVYWDLFRRGNQNRGTGNTEAIWVRQYEYNTPGGGDGDVMARFLVPLYWQLKDNDGVNAFIGPTSQNGGRGIGWWAPSDYMMNGVWEGANDDIRNSEFNIIRDLVIDNPESQYFGQKMIESGAISEFSDPIKRWWNVIFAKSTPINNFPDELIADSETGLTTSSANHSYRDRYYMRLAETYLLRAEAYMLSGNLDMAAADINTVRERSNADPITAADVNLDFILDERARELFTEEFRLLTLMRTGKIVERVRTYNPMHNGQYENHQIKDTQTLWPIPNGEIEKNTEAVLEQNPGY